MTLIKHVVHRFLRYTLSMVLHHLGTLYNPIFSQLFPEQLYENTFWCVRFILIRHFTIPIFDSGSLKWKECFLSLITTDKVKMHLTEAIHSWLAMAPMREHSPHNNELLRLPEDTMLVQRIEIKRQVRCGENRWGQGGGKGGYEFNIEQLWDILHWLQWDLQHSNAEWKCTWYYVMKLSYS